MKCHGCHVQRLYGKSGKLSDACLDCGMCERKCPQHLKIREELKKVESIFKTI